LKLVKLIIVLIFFLKKTDLVREGSKSKGEQPSSLAKVLKKKFSEKD